MQNWIDKAFDLFDIKLTFKKRIVVIIGLLAFFFGIGALFVSAQYTSFNELASKNINEESIIQSISISVRDISDETAFPETKTKATIKDKNIMEELLNDFSKIELVKDRNDAGWYEEYAVDVLTTIEDEDGILRTETFGFNIGEKYLDGYKIISETDHLKTIEALVESEEVEWEER